MARTTLTGSRIRERRLAMRLKQADLARTVGISPSYLNLIEHNRRRIAGKLINDIARALDVETSALTEGAEAALVTSLREAAADHPGATGELDRLEEFVGRFPGWSALMAETRRRADELERTVEILSDRMTHDPFLSASMHEILSTVTAIRSTAQILVETRDIDPEWRDRFHRNMSEESARLTESAEALVKYLDESTSSELTGSTPQEELESWLQGMNYHVEALETASGARVEALIDQADSLRSAAARSLATRYLEQYARDAALMPLAQFAAAASECHYDPAALASQFHTDLSAVFRRLASLPLEEEAGTIGLVTCDGSGTLVFRKPVAGFTAPQFSAACPLWPLYQVLSRPMTPVRRQVEIGGRMPQRFLTYAICQPSQPAGFDGPQVLEASMLLLTEELSGLSNWTDAQPIGSSCRICPRGDCAARREPSIMSEVF